MLFNSDDAGNADYMTGVEVADFSNVPATFTRLRVAAQRYAVFTHRLHISESRRTRYTIWNKWLPQLERDEGVEALDAPDFERLGWAKQRGVLRTDRVGWGRDLGAGEGVRY